MHCERFAMTRDYQKSRVYEWEDGLFKNYKQTPLSLADAQSWIDFIWANEGRIAPPKVSIKERITVGGTATRSNIVCGEKYLNFHILTHECAHALIAIHHYEGGQGKCYKHGPVFVSTYAGLLVKYLKFDRSMVYKTLKDANIDFNGIG